MPSSAMNIESTIPSPATAGVVDVARRIASAAEFIEHHYLGGLMMQTMPLHPFMSYLHHRLLNYEWLLLKSKRAFLPDEDPLPPPKEAIKILKWLKAFFYHRADSEREILKQVNDRALGDDVGFVGDLTERLLEGKERMTEREMDAVLEVNKRQAVALRAAHDALEEPLRRPWELTEMVLREFEEAEDGSVEGGMEEALIEEAYGDAQEEVNGICTPVDNESAGRTTPSSHNSAGQEPSPQGPRIHAHQPYHTSGRAWFVNPVTFADLIGSPIQWAHPPPSTYILISSTSNNDSDEGASHFIDATALGIPGLTTLKLEHPLDENAVRNLDWDVLRFLRLALWDSTNGHPERKGERESLEVVRAELRRRVAEVPKTPVVDKSIRDEDGSRFKEIGTTDSINGDAELLAKSEERRELPSTSSTEDDDGIRTDGVAPNASSCVGSLRNASNTSLNHLFESAHLLPEPNLYTNANINETLSSLRSQPYEDPNNHINDHPQTTQSPSYLMSMSGAYNPVTPLLLDSRQEAPTLTDPTSQKPPTLPKLPPSTPDDAPSIKPCCFTRMKQKLRSSRRQSPTTANSTRAPTSPPPLTPPSSPSTASTLSSLSSSDPWLAPLNTSYRYNPSPSLSPKSPKLRSSRGRGRIEKTIQCPLEEKRRPEMGFDFDFDFDVDERVPVEMIDGLRVGEV